MTPGVAPSAPPAFTGRSAPSGASGHQSSPTSDSPAATDAAGNKAGTPSATGPPGSATGPPAAGFASVLHEVARTAPAEGQSKTGDKPANGPNARGQQASDPGAPGTTALAADLASVMAQPSGAAAAASAGVGAATAASTTGLAADGGGNPAGAPGNAIALSPGNLAADPAAPGLPASGPTNGAPAAPGAAQGAGAGQTPGGTGQGPASATLLPTPSGTASAASLPPGAANASPVAPGAAGASPAPTNAAPTPAGAPGAPGGGRGTSNSASGTQNPATVAGQTTSQAPLAPGTGSNGEPSGGQPSPAPAQPASAGGPAQPAPVSAQGHPGQSSAQLTPIAVQQATLSTAAAPADAGSAMRPGAGLEHAIETVRLTIDMAARQGVSQARIQLSPESLGGIRIQLSQTADGLVARVVAEHSAAAQTLQQGGAELRRSLESAGVPLLRLDIESSGQGGGSAQDPGRAGGGARKHAELPAEGPDDASPASPVTAVQLSNGAVVNVLA